MANTIRIKRPTSSNRPSSLANAEMAFIEGSQILVYGTGTGGVGGSATSIIDIGGTGAFLGLASNLTQTAAGTYTFSGAVTFSGTTSLGSATATTQSSSDNSTKVATTAYVKSQGYLTSETYVGTVTSVALSLPNIFSVSGSPITSNGTLSATLSTQTANYVWAGPTTGSAATPTFRALVAGDIPTLTASKISDLATTVQAYRLDQFAAPSHKTLVGGRIQGRRLVGDRFEVGGQLGGLVVRELEVRHPDPGEVLRGFLEESHQGARGKLCPNQLLGDLARLGLGVGVGGDMAGDAMELLVKGLARFDHLRRRGRRIGSRA